MDSASAPATSQYAGPDTATGAEAPASGESSHHLDVAGPEELSPTSLGDEVRQREFRIIIQALKKERGRRNRAAEQLGISPRTLRYKLAQMRDAGIDLDAELAAA
jgi:two-component system response regulator FlrC